MAVQAVQWALLEEQERILAPLVAAFRAVDPGSTGILSPTQCQRFCRLLHPQILPQEADLLQGALDCGTGQVSTPCMPCSAGQYWLLSYLERRCPVAHALMHASVATRVCVMVCTHISKHSSI